MCRKEWNNDGTPIIHGLCWIGIHHLRSLAVCIHVVPSVALFLNFALLHHTTVASLILFLLTEDSLCY